MKKKLLFINGHLNTGGVEKALLDMSVPDSAERLCKIMEDLIAGKKRR